MKKILFSALAFCTFAFANAQSILEVAPLATVAGDDVAATENLLTFVVDGDATKFASFQFDLYVPDGIVIDETFPVEGAGLPTNRGKYLHTITAGSVDSDMPGYTKYTFLGFDTKSSNFTANELFSVYCGTTDDVAEGVYPVYLKNIKLAKGQEGDRTDVVTTYVKVGSPKDKTFAVEGNLSTAVNSALAKETAISSLNLEKVTAVNGVFTYVDGREVVAPATDVVADLKYTHADGKYYSVKAPFAYETSAKVYTFNGVSGEYANFTEATSVPANTPVLVEGALELNAKAAIGGVASEAKSNVYYVQGETLYHGNNITVKPMRGVWEGAAASNLRIAIDGVVTGIDAAQIDAQSNSFDLQGRQVQNTKNGVFVVNGKKQFVK